MINDPAIGIGRPPMVHPFAPPKAPKATDAPSPVDARGVAASDRLPNRASLVALVGGESAVVATGASSGLRRALHGAIVGLTLAAGLVGGGGHALAAPLAQVGLSQEVGDSARLAEPARPSAAATEGTTAPRRASRRAHVVTEEMEQALLQGSNGTGKLVDVAANDGTDGITITVHGINGSPQTIQAFSDHAASQGKHVKTFAYDDRHRSLQDSSRELATAIADWKAEHPGRPIDIQTHSMGGRVVLGALQNLQDWGVLDDGAPVRLTMVAPPLGGFASANTARWAPRVFDSLIGGVAPGRDMGTTSDFQQTLEKLTLPANVHTNIVLGTLDTLVDATMSGFKRISENLRARVSEISGADHTDIVTHRDAALPTWNIADGHHR